MSLDQKTNIDPISALYVDKTTEQLEADEKMIGFFSWLLDHRTLEELLR